MDVRWLRRILSAIERLPNRGETIRPPRPRPEPLRRLEIDDALWQKCLAAATRGRLPGHDGEYLMTAEEHAALIYLLSDCPPLGPSDVIGESPLKTAANRVA